MPIGNEQAGNPAKLTERVNISELYSDTGALFGLSNWKAVVGVVGVNMRSTFLNAVIKSSRISRRTCCAL